MERGIWLLTALAVWTHLNPVKGAVRITQCPQGGVALREDRYPAVFSCEGFSDTENVTWTVKHKGLDQTLSITCRPEDMFCGFSADLDVLVRRRNVTSELKIIKEYRWRAGDESVRCSATNSGTDSCDIEVFRPARLLDCQVTTNITDWTVSGSCDYVGAYVSPPHEYYCNWFQSRGEQTNRINSTELTKHQIVVNNAEYYNGTCTFSTPLSEQEGRYAYSVVVFPGPPRTHVDDVTILIPGDPITSCPNHVTTTTNISCDCLPNPTAPGSPLPTVQWRGRSPGQRLVIADLARADTENIPVCQLTWGPVDARVNKETQLAFGPDDVHIIEPQGLQVADEDFALTCELSNVYPSARVTWTTPSDVVCRHDGVTCNFVLKRWHDGENVTCTAQNSLFPDVLFGSSTYTIRLTSSPVTISSTEGLAGTTEAAPDRAVASELIVAIVCVVLAFLLILFIVAVLVATRRGRRRRLATSRISIYEDKTDGLGPHDNPIYNETNEAIPQLQQQRPSLAALRMSTISEESVNAHDVKTQADVEHSTVTYGDEQASSADHHDVVVGTVPLIRVSPPLSDRRGSSRPVSAVSDQSASKDSAIDEDDPYTCIDSDVDGDVEKSNGIPAGFSVGTVHEDETGSKDGTQSPNSSVDEDEACSSHGAQSPDNTGNEDDLSSHDFDQSSPNGNTVGANLPDETATQENIDDEDDPSTHVYAVVDKSYKRSNGIPIGSSNEAVNLDENGNDGDSLTNLYTSSETEQGEAEFELYSPMYSDNP